jgi:hypothetical protein
MLGGRVRACLRTSFVDKLQPYVAEWASVAHEKNVVTEHRLHDGAA